MSNLVQDPGDIAVEAEGPESIAHQSSFVINSLYWPCVYGTYILCVYDYSSCSVLLRNSYSERGVCVCSSRRRGLSMIYERCIHFLSCKSVVTPLFYGVADESEKALSSPLLRRPSQDARMALRSGYEYVGVARTSTSASK